MKTITFKEYTEHMRKTYFDFVDENNFYSVVLDVYKSLQKSDKSYYNDIHEMLSFTPTQRLHYRAKMAEEGKEMTPEHVDQLIESMQYALERAERII